MLDQLIVALPMVRQERLNMIIEQLSAGSIDVCIMPREFLVLRDRYRRQLYRFAAGAERLAAAGSRFRRHVEDGAGLVAGLLWAHHSLTAADSHRPCDQAWRARGPIFFKQKRFGFNNLEIDVLKFRSMYVDKQDVTGAARTTKDDPRVTFVGRIIRRTSIDELPQLLNVLRGDMSIVGPRPHATVMRVGESLLSRCGARLCRPASRPARDHGSRAGARLARRNRYDRARERSAWNMIPIISRTGRRSSICASFSKRFSD